jgi:hypothetical protein
MRKGFFATAATVLSLGYLLPCAIAYYNDHRNTTAITIVNLFLGWTLIGWVAALVWALSQPAAVISVPGDTGVDSARRPCPRCAEAILPDARVCRYCGAELPLSWAG